MPILNNPEVQNYLQAHNTPISGALREVGLLQPSAPMYFSPASPDYQISSLAGNAIGDTMEGRKLLRPVGSYFASFNQNPARAALLSALGMGVAGAGFGAMTGRDPVVSGLVGAGLGAAGGYGLGQLVQGAAARRERPRQLLKAAFYMMNDEDPTSYIQSRLFADPSIGSQQKLFSLASMIRSAGGAMVGYIIGHFLLNMGGMGSGIAAGLGGLMGARSGGGPMRNAVGLAMNTRQDPFGNPRLV
jgi:hypothetical protein